MTIDISKIKPGDTGTIKVEFLSCACDGLLVKVAPFIEGRLPWKITIPTSIIATHTPAPWMPEPGDVVTIIFPFDETQTQWTIITVDGRWFFLGKGDYMRKIHNGTSGLTLVRKGDGK